MSERRLRFESMNPSGVAPPVSINGWTATFVEDFATDVARGAFVGHPAYAPRWSAYNTGWRTSKPWQAGWYNNSILEVQGSALILNVHTDTLGHPLVAALRPKLSPVKPWGMTAVRQSIRFKCDPLPGYKLAWMLWPDSNVWPRDGEIDCPECNLDGVSTIRGFMHRQGAVAESEGGMGGADQDWAKSTVNPVDGLWHTATINYKPGSWRTPMCEFLVDGKLIGKFSKRVPNGPMHSVIQTEPYLRTQRPDPTVAGRIWVDWFVAYKPS